MSESRKVEMQDGRTVEIGEKTRMKKEYGVADSGAVFCQIDFDNGETVRIEIDPHSETGKQALGHGLSQKLGDSAAGADSTQDAYEAVLELAARIAKGEWRKTATPGEGGSAKGASELVEALVAVLGQPKDVVRGMLAELKQADKMGLRKTPAVAQEIERLRAARGPSKAEQEKLAASNALIASLKEGIVPVRVEADEGDAE